MPIQSKDLDAKTGDAFDFTAGNQDYIVEAKIYVASETGNGVSSNGFSGVSVLNNGYITAANYGVYFRDAQGELKNLSGATVYGKEGVYATAAGTVVDNQGTISGRDRGVWDTAGTASVDNDGEITGRSFGVALSGNGNDLHNTGSIFANDGVAGIGAEIDTTARGQTATIENTGLIRGKAASIASTGNGALTIENSGRLEGSLSLANAGGVDLTNRGEIDGNVVLGNGTNTYDGRGGSVTGTIEGGHGADTMYAGKHGDTMFGGGGHDLLHGGSGHDTFGLDSYSATSSDRIFGFSVKDDTIELDHATFTKLTAGAAPAFTVGSAASSATDYLFYNDKSGGLYYDPDGSGSGKADLLANLGPGLKMTAHDFKVV